LIFAVDASTWPRCDAETSPERGFHYSATKHSAGQPIVAGWSYQLITQLDWAFDSWTAPLDILRLSPTMDATTSTIDQVKRLVSWLPADGQVPMFVFDARSPSPMVWHQPAPRCSSASAHNGYSTLIQPHGRPVSAAGLVDTGTDSHCRNRRRGPLLTWS
jgi:hypothetical protein